MKNIIYTLRDFLVYMALCAGTICMLATISQYAYFRTDVGFLNFKQDYIHIPLWNAAFYTHVFTSILLLAAGLTQFSNYVLQEHRKLHRIVGRIYAIGIIFINFPAGMTMAVYANGGITSKLAFIILDCLWFCFTLKAVIEIRKGNIDAHRKFMIRSFALTCSAVTLRTWKIILTNTLHLPYETIYMIDAWLGFVPNLLFAEWLISERFRKKRQLPQELPSQPKLGQYQQRRSEKHQ